MQARTVSSLLGCISGFVVAVDKSQHSPAAATNDADPMTPMFPIGAGLELTVRLAKNSLVIGIDQNWIIGLNWICQLSDYHHESSSFCMEDLNTFTSPLGCRVSAVPCWRVANSAWGPDSEPK